MGYAEDARSRLAEAEAEERGDALGLAQVYATLAVLERVDALVVLVSMMAEAADRQRSREKPHPDTIW